MDDDLSSGGEHSPILLSDGEEQAPDEPSGSQRSSSASESPMMFVDQDHDEDAPSESGSPESASPEQESEQPGATILPEADDTDSSQTEEDDEEEAQAEPEQQEGTSSPESEPAQRRDESDHGEDDDDYETDQSEDEDEYEGRAACNGAECQTQCNQYEQRILAKDRRNDDLRATISQKNARIRVLENRITDLALQVRGLGGHPVWGGRRRRRPGQQRPENLTPRGMSQWQNLLRESISGNESYTKAWKSSQQTLNMPIDNRKTHPGIRFVPKDSPDVPENMSPERDPIIARMPEGVQLPDDVLFRILEHLLWYDGFLCHCISRLDLHHEPISFPTQREIGRECTGIRGRFFFSEDQLTPISLTHDTLDPNVVLAALLVSRKWCWYGVHIFCK